MPEQYVKFVQSQWQSRSTVFFVNFEHISTILQGFLLLALKQVNASQNEAGKHTTKS